MKRSIIAGLATLLLVLVWSGCSHNEEGPMEKTGKAIDEAAEETGEAVKEGAEEVGEAAEEVGDAAEDAVK